jgi:thymidylate synthase
MKNKLDRQYQMLLQTILDHGINKADRTGTGTRSIFGYTIRHNMKDGFPLLTTKKMAWKTMVTELLWFLRGDTNIKFLVDNNCHIWDGDAYKNYLKHTITGVENGLDRIKGHLDNCLVEFEGSYEHFTNPSFAYGFRPHTQEEFINKIKTDDEFAKKWGELGPIYGSQWRDWGSEVEFGQGESVLYGGVDQIQKLINDLKTNPDSRRLMVNAWNVKELDQMVLPPCHYGFQVYTRPTTREEKIVNPGKYRAISLMWNQRSVDTFLGLPFNIASYGLLLEIIAKAVDMVPDQLIGNLGDTHLYLNHLDQAKEQIGREMTWEEQVQWVMKNTDVELENLYIVEEIAKDSTPKRTRQPFPLPKLNINTEFWPTESGECGVGPIDALAVVEGFYNENFCKCLLEEDIQLYDYQSHPTIKAPLSN